MIREVHTDDLRALIPTLRCGDRLLLSGTVYTARDAAHKRLFALLDQGLSLPFPLTDGVIYYAGPTPAQKGMAVGSCGPTTSGRMDPYAPRLLDLGLAAMIGKGPRSQSVVDAIVRSGGIYLCTTGGAGALIAGCVTAAEEIAFPELGCESVKRFTVEKMPVTVAIDTKGNSIFSLGRNAYRKPDA